MASDQTPLDVLVAHQRQDISSCLCGWSELGQSFCQHQIAALDAAGFAIVKRPTGAAKVELWKRIQRVMDRWGWFQSERLATDAVDAVLAAGWHPPAAALAATDAADKEGAGALERVRKLLAEWDADVMTTPDAMHTHATMRNELRRALAADKEAGNV